MRIDAAPGGVRECDNGIDDDGDGLIDWQQDLGCSSKGDGSEGGAATGSLEDGWTSIERAKDTRIVFASSSIGRDDYDGLAPRGSGKKGPKKTLGAALALLRSGSADWLLLRRGDSWSEGVAVRVAGRSPSQPIVIASYGDSLERPILRGPAEIGSPNVMLLHLDVEVGARDSPAIAISGPGHVLVEGCRLAGGLHGVYGGGTKDSKLVDLHVRRNVVMSSQSSGFYFTSTRDLLVEENVIYKPALSNSNHGMYITRAGNENVVTRGNLVLMGKPAGNGIMQRPGGIAEGNVVVGAGWNGITMGTCNDDGGPEGGACYPPVPVQIRGNLLMDGTGLGGGIAIEPDFVQPRAVISGNILLRAEVHAGAEGLIFQDNLLEDAPLSIAPRPNITWRNNRILGTKDAVLVCADDLPGAKGFVAQGNRYYSRARNPQTWFTVPHNVGFSGWRSATGETGSGDAFEVVDPNRTLATYDRSIGGTGSTESFFQGALQQGKFHYLPQYTAAATIGYFREGLQLVGTQQH